FFISYSLFQRHLLNSPVRHLADQQVVFVPAVDRVRESALFQLLAGPYGPADHLAVERRLVDGGVFHAVLVARVRDVEILRRSARHAHRQRRADVAELRLELALAVEDLDALVAGIGDVDIARVRHGDRLHAGELALAGAGRSPVRDELAVLVELRDAVVGADAVGDIDVGGLVPRDVGRAAETRTGNTGAWRTAGLAAAESTSARRCCRLWRRARRCARRAS